MARSLLGSFVSGTRQMLSAQLFISICAIALAAWTLGVTNELIRERDRLRERVIQLEQTMAARGEMPPTPSAVVARPATTGYPGSIETAVGAENAAPSEAAPGNISRMIGDLFAPPPPMRTVVLHARSEEDAGRARDIASELSEDAGVRALVAVTAPGDSRPAGYAYYDGRQNRAAVALVQQFNDIAREQQIAFWAAQLRGTALPAQGEYTADRLDIILPALPAAPAVSPDPLSRGPQISPDR